MSCAEGCGPRDGTAHEAAGGPYGGTYTGPDVVLENVFGRIGSEWEDFAAVPDGIVCDGEHGVVTGTYSGRFRATGRSLQARFAHSWLRRDGRFVRFEQFTDTVAWRAAAN